MNAVGFGAFDFFELLLAGLLVALAIFWRSRVYPALAALSARPWVCAAVVGALPVVLRVALLHNHPIPTPLVADDFSFLLMADTFRHLRLANPVHPLFPFFESLFLLQQPSYSSIFSPGQGLILAAGWNLFGNPWAGVALSIAAMCAGCYWMLRGWTTPVLSLVGGLFAALSFGPLSQWMNSFWGGAVSGCAGCLVFGALPRFRNTRRPMYAGLLGLGLAIQLLSRPFESILLGAAVLVYFALEIRRRPGVRAVAVGSLPILAAAAFTGTYNHAVTGNWTTLPYQVSRYQYGVPPTFTFQPNAVPHRELTRQQQLDYQLESKVHGSGEDTPARFLGRLWQRFSLYRFFFVPPLLIAVAAFFWTLHRRDSAFLALVVAIFALGTNFFPYFYAHYLAALTSVFMLIGMIGLARLGRAGVLVGYLCAFHFVFWYGVHLLGSTSKAKAYERFETGNNINGSDLEDRVTVRREIEKSSGNHLVFVRYNAMHSFDEWVYNDADIDAERIVWARDRGVEDQKLIDYYPGRTVWILEPDVNPPHLQKYSAEESPIIMEQAP